MVGWLLAFMLLASPVSAGVASAGGDDDRIDCGTGSSLNVTTGDFSLCALSNGSPASTGVIAGKGRNDADGIRYTIKQLSSDVMRFEFDDNTTKVSYSGATTHENVWVWTCVIANGNNGELWINGVQDANSPGDITGHNTYDHAAEPFRLFAQKSNSGGQAIQEEWTGTIAEVYLWVGTALSASEVAQLHNSKVKRIGLQIQSATLAAAWFLDEVSEGTSADTLTFADSSSNSNTCTGVVVTTSLTGEAESYLSYP